MIKRKFGKVISFYSYKGGTGRSMSLANIACILAEEKKRENRGVLVVDWDLEAPGLHRFFHKYFISKSEGDYNDISLEEKPGLLEVFYQIKDILSNDKIKYKEDNAEILFNKLNIQDYVLNTDINNLYFIKAGSFDGNYSTRVKDLNFADLYYNYPWLFKSFSLFLSSYYQYILIDSRTGDTDIGGICTSIMPEKLVIVFNTNIQNYLGIKDILTKVIKYRRNSDDLRPLSIFPLPSRIETSEPEFHELWRRGNIKKGMFGYQEIFENIFKDIYKLDKCDLNNYFDDVQIQHIPRYSYGEEIAVLQEKDDDRLSISRSYRDFTKHLIGFKNPWEEKHSIKIERNKYLLHFNDIKEPIKSGWVPYHGLTQFDKLNIKIDKDSGVKILQSESDRFENSYDWVIDYNFDEYIEPIKVCCKFKTKYSEPLGLYFKIKNKSNVNYDYWLVYRYKHDLNFRTIISNDTTIAYDPIWPNEITYLLENLYPNAFWEDWVSFKRNIVVDLDRAIEFLNHSKSILSKNVSDQLIIFKSFQFYGISGIRIHGPCDLEFIEFEY